MQPNAPHVEAYFTSLIQNELENADIQCSYAGDQKGKAIYASKAFGVGEPIWTEKPFVAMQHEISKDFIDACEHCFVPLINSKECWERVVKTCEEATDDDDVPKVTEKDLDETVDYLQKEGGKSEEESYFRVFKLAEHHVMCDCGAIYCSPACQNAANEEYHKLLCTHSDTNDTPMGQFVNHTVMTNEVFQLAAKVIGKVLLRFVATHDLAAAREPVDMFCKMPWYEVIASEDDLEDGQTMEEYQACFKDLLAQTLGHFRTGLRDNLERLEKLDALNGLSVETILSSCDEILTVDFFANVVGMFEMNNISMEIDHPFHALREALNEEKEDQKQEDPAVLERVKKALAFYAKKYERPGCHDGCCHDDDCDEDHDHEHDHDDDQVEDEDDLEHYDQGFYGVDGTALFSGICTMNHSCDPNCTVLYTKDGAAHVFAVKDIQAGEELCISYIDVDQEWAARQECLRYVLEGGNAVP